MAQATVKKELSAELSFKTNTADYGVDHSPVWGEIDLSSVTLDNVWWFGKDWTEAELRMTFGDMAVEAIIGYLSDNIEEWDDE